MLDAGHRQLCPPYARVGAKSLHQPVRGEALPHERIGRVIVADDITSTLAHRLNGVIWALWPDEHSRQGGHYQAG